MIRMKKILLTKSFCLAVFILAVNLMYAQDKKDYFTIENYYKVKWGFADEFINL